MLSASTEGGTSAIVSPAGAYLSDGTAVVTATPAPGWTFLQWLGDASGTNPTASVAMSRNKCVRAVFGTALSHTVVGSGSVVCSPVSGLYPYGSGVRLSAVPQAGNYFVLWGNAASGTNNPLSFTITNANPTVTAVFAALGGSGTFALTVVPNGFGQVLASPRANRYATGTNVTLTALPDAGQSFLSWSGDASGTNHPLVVTMNPSKVITANFTKRPRLEVFTCGGVLDPANVPLQMRGEPGRVQFNDAFVTNRTQRFYRAMDTPIP